MPALGGGNPLPFELGGGPSRVEQVFTGMKQALGDGGYALDDETMDGQWRLALAKGAVASLSDERAVKQWDPSRATSWIPVWEKVLLITASDAQSDEERRQVILDRYVATLTAVTGTLEAALQVIDPLFSVVDHDPDTADTTHLGRMFEDWDPSDPDACGPAFGGGRTSTLWPNYSEDLVIFVQYAIASGTMTAENQRRLNRAEAILNQALPAWVGFRIFTSLGFILDESLLDVGAFGP